MPENDFEKQVQQKMDELQFVPSDAVWPEVERHIAEPKKRRGVFFWLPLGALLLGSTAWIYLFGTREAIIKKQPADKEVTKASANDKNQPGNITAAIHDNKKTAVLNDSTSNSATGNTSVDLGTNNTGKNGSTAIKNPGSNKDRKNKITVNGAIDPALNNSHEKIVAAIIRNTKHINSIPGKKYNPDLVAKRTDNKTKLIPVIDGNEGATIAASSAIEEKDNSVAHSLQNKFDALPVADSIGATDSMTISKTSNDSLTHTNKTNDSKVVAKTKTITKAKKKIDWRINLNAGLSSVSDGFSGLFSNSPTYNNSAFLSNQQSVSGSLNGGSLSAAVTQPSGISAGFSYTAGMFVRIPLNKKFNLLTGINYAYYSNSLKTGAKSDSIRTVYYALGNSNSYTNRFHFIEIPITVELNMARFAVNGGLSFSILAGTNAILYNEQGKYYFRNNSLVNKMQAGLLAGFSYRLFPKTMPIEIGPQLNYNLSSIFNKNLYGNRHLLFTGINAKFFLHKK